MTVDSPFAAALNRLLDAEPWARERLAPFAGAALELRGPPLPALRFTIGGDGRLEPGMPPGAPALRLTAGPGALAAAFRGEEYLMRAVAVEGDSRLAAEVLYLVRHLRWDFEESAARLLGDVAAHRLGLTARAVAGWHLDAARRLGESLAEYAIEERRLLVSRSELGSLAQDGARLRDALERLERRIARLEGAR